MSSLILLFLVILSKSACQITHFASFTKALDNIGACGFQPKAVLDVGANNGDWSKAMKQKYPTSDFFLIEGNADHRASLSSTNLKFVISLVGDKRGNITFYKAKQNANTGNSIFKESTSFFVDSMATVLPITTVDDLVASNGVGPFQLMKIDVQGAEIMSLKGSFKTMESVEVLFTEAPIVQYNEGSPSFLDLYKLLDSMGFAIFDMTDQLRLPGNFGGNKGLIPTMLVQFDVMWVKKNSLLWHENCTGFQPPKDFKDKFKFNQVAVPLPLNDSIQLFGFATHINDAVCSTLETASLAGFTFQLLGPTIDTSAFKIGKGENGKKLSKLVVLRSIANALPSETVLLFADTFDMTFQDSFSSFTARYNELKSVLQHKVVFGTESNCWPFMRLSEDYRCPLMQGDAYLKANAGKYVVGTHMDSKPDALLSLTCQGQVDKVPNPFRASRQKFLNSGLSIGSASSYKELIEFAWSKLNTIPEICVNDDQAVFGWMFGSNTTSREGQIVLDYSQTFFLNKYENHLIFNKTCGAWTFDRDVFINNSNFAKVSPIIHHAGDKQDHKRFRDALFHHKFMGDVERRDAFLKSAIVYIDGIPNSLFATCRVKSYYF